METFKQLLLPLLPDPLVNIVFTYANHSVPVSWDCAAKILKSAHWQVPLQYEETWLPWLTELEAFSLGGFLCILERVRDEKIKVRVWETQKGAWISYPSPVASSVNERTCATQSQVHCITIARWWMFDIYSRSWEHVSRTLSLYNHIPHTLAITPTGGDRLVLVSSRTANKTPGDIQVVEYDNATRVAKTIRVESGHHELEQMLEHKHALCYNEQSNSLVIVYRKYGQTQFASILIEPQQRIRIQEHSFVYTPKNESLERIWKQWSTVLHQVELNLKTLETQVSSLGKIIGVGPRLL